MVSFPYPDPSYNLTEKERDQAMLLYHTFMLYKKVAFARKHNLSINPDSLQYRRKKIEEYQKKVLTNR